MNKRVLSNINLAIVLANKGDHPLAKIGAVLVKNGKVIGVGFNKIKNHPMQQRFDKVRGFSGTGIHAEIDCIRNAVRNFNDTENATMYIARVTKNNTLANSKPCKGCHAAILEFGISVIYYTDENGEITKGLI